ncbi:ArnT family glycosyltransferase, partial [Streptomyces sp. NPDC000229]|uniref:ArnT family glycosyltransferase n=1 Tax=Streptomyces sp. NPDC000229 TaxID=3154247 RepID=UPI003328E9BB
MQETRVIAGSPDSAPLATPDDGHSPTAGASTRPLPWLAAVAAAFTLAQLALVMPGLGLGWDETVYVSQVSPQAPAAFFSAPRARGISFLVAPVAALTTSVEALRVHLALLSGCGLFLGLWVWRRLLPVPVLATAGALFATLWVTMFYGPQAMPNLWVAYGALAAVGFFLRAVRDPADRWALPGLGAGVALAALMRPTDAVWLALPLAAAALLMRPAHRRPWAVPAVLAAGLVLGCAPWVVEAYAHYGGLHARLRRASEIQGHLGWYFAVDDHVRALGGRTLCRPCDVPWRLPQAAVWFLALPLLVAGGVWAAARTRDRVPIVLATVTGLVLAAPYLFTVGYAAPRFLLPAYALLALPVARFLLRIVRPARPGKRRSVGVVLVAVAVTGHLAVQYRVLDSVADRVRRDTVALGRIAAELHAQGVRPPCVVSGEDAIRVAFRAGCASRQPSGHDGSITPEGLTAMGERIPVAVLVSDLGGIPRYARQWRVHRLPDLGHRTGLRGYLAPAAGVARGLLGPHHRAGHQ